jgi:hypothetical protein
MPQITKLQENSQMLQAQGKASKLQQLQLWKKSFFMRHHEENRSFLSVVRMVRNLIPHIKVWLKGRENHSTVDSLLFSLHVIGFDSKRNSMIQHREYNQTTLTYQSITSVTDYSNAPSRQQKPSKPWSNGKQNHLECAVELDSETCIHHRTRKHSELTSAGYGHACSANRSRLGITSKLPIKYIHYKLEPQKNLYCSFISNLDLCLGSRSISDRCNLLQLPNDNYNASLDQGIHWKKLVESWCKY